MSRKRRHRASRTLTLFVAAAAATGAIYQVHHLRAARAHAIASQQPPSPAAKPQLASAAAFASAPATRPAAASTGAPSPNLASAAVMRSTLPLLASAGSAASAQPSHAVSASLLPLADQKSHAMLPDLGMRDTPLLATTTQPTSTQEQAGANTSAQLASASMQPASVSIGAQSISSGTGHPLADAQTAFADGQLLTARKILNDALNANTLSSTDADAARARISQINQTVVFSTEKFPDDPYGGIVTVRPGQKLSSIATTHGITWQLLMQLNNLTDARKLRAGQTLKVIQGPFYAVVTKHTFTMDLYLGATPGSANAMYVTSFPVGLGKDDSTPTGTWMIQNRVRHPTYYSPRGEGVIAADDPKNPLGPYWLGLTGTDGHAVGKQSYGIHGTIDPDSIGHMASMGCIRMRNEQVAVVFEMLTEGKSLVVVRD